MRLAAAGPSSAPQRGTGAGAAPAARDRQRGPSPATHAGPQYGGCRPAAALTMVQMEASLRTVISISIRPTRPRAPRPPPLPPAPCWDAAAQLTAAAGAAGGATAKRGRAPAVRPTNGAGCAPRRPPRGSHVFPVPSVPPLPSAPGSPTLSGTQLRDDVASSRRGLPQGDRRAGLRLSSLPKRGRGRPRRCSCGDGVEREVLRCPWAQVRSAAMSLSPGEMCFYILRSG